MMSSGDILISSSPILQISFFGNKKPQRIVEAIYAFQR
jgi:hypothetical protein